MGGKVVFAAGGGPSSVSPESYENRARRATCPAAARGLTRIKPRALDPGVDDGVGRALGTEHDHEVADHLGLLVVAEIDDLLGFQVFESQLDHTDGTFDDFLPGGDHGGGLLALEHGAGDLGGVGQVADACLDDLDAGDGKAGGQASLELVVDLGGSGAQGDLGVVVLEVVVRIMPGQFAQGRLVLDADEMRVVVHLEHGPEGVADAPDEHGADHDRVADLVVDLDRLAVEVAGPDGDLALAEEGVDPREAVALDRSLVLAQENHHGMDVGLQRKKAFQPENGQQEAQSTRREIGRQGRQRSDREHQPNDERQATVYRLVGPFHAFFCQGFHFFSVFGG